MWPSACLSGLVGPDGVVKSSLFALVDGTRRVQQGPSAASRGDMATLATVAGMPRIALPQGLGNNLSPANGQTRNVDFFAAPVFGLGRASAAAAALPLPGASTRASGPSCPPRRASFRGDSQKLGLCAA